VISPIVAGENWSEEGAEKPLPDDMQYVVDLGLIRNDGGNYVIANEIYREVLPRELSYIMQVSMTSRPTQAWYVGSEGKIDMGKLLREFQLFFRENIGSWKEGFDYKEAGFQLLLQAFLQRIVNGGGLIDREYALGSGRVDLLVRWRYPKDAAVPGVSTPGVSEGISPLSINREVSGGVHPLSLNSGIQRIVLELKTIRASSHDPNRAFSEGLEQTARYAEQSAAQEAHLIVCDERPGRSWDEKIYERSERYADRDIRIWGV
jgi:hypothetical protein